LAEQNYVYSAQEKNMTTFIFRSFYAAVLLLIFTVLPNPAQQADVSFGGTGLVATNLNGINPFGSNQETAVKVFYLADGKLLAVCNHKHISPKSGPYNTMTLIRYRSDGAYDAPNSGVIAAKSNFIATDAEMQPDGKIVIVGYTYQNASQETGADWAIARYNQNGTFDTISGFPWFIVRGFGSNLDFATNVEIQPDGKIVVSGYSTTQVSGGQTVTVVARYNPDASADAAFGPYGDGFFDIYDNGAVSKDLIVQPDGKFLLAGDSSGDALVARFNSAGVPDVGFGSGGYVILNYNNQEILNDIELQPDGKILALLDSNSRLAGATNYFEQTSVLARLNADGSKDLSFTPNGAVFINTSPADYPSENPPSVLGFESARSLILRGNGNVLVSGVSVQNILPGSQRRFLYTVMEYDGGGRLVNKTFSRYSQRPQVVSIQYFSAFQGINIEGSLLQPDGKILLYGSFGFPSDIGLARYAAVSAVKTPDTFFDYNFDGTTDYAVFRPNNNGLGNWYFLSRNNFQEREYGTSGDIPTPGDYDGDNVQDLAVFRPTTGEWISRKVYLNNCAPMDCVETIQFGANGDIPAPGDFDGDGKTDRAVFRPANGDWYILLSSGGVRGLHFGQNGDKPVTGDYDGDGRADVAVIRRENGKMSWYILQSSDGQFIGLQFGITEDKTVVADYNGDGKSDIAVWRPSNGTWYVLANYTDFSAAQFGTNGDVPEPSDYDNDRKADFAVFRPNGGVHYVLNSATGNSVGVQFGAANDIPVASAYVR
jgi:uncharacterized delta-60 repeat protein